MRHVVRYIVLFAATLACALPLRAQFYQNGDNPGSARWSHFKTADFHLIYPSGLDSLALQYAMALEKYRIPVSRSAAYAPNEKYSNQMPVVLDAFHATPNGSVVWTPRRMELYTVPDAYSPDAFPWIKNLAIHESRHVSQMQFVRDFKVLDALTGQLSGGAMSAVYGGPAFMEGDAVTAETALTRYGRGRKAEFLEYMMVAFDNGDMRNWYRWRYTSARQYTPDHYKVGYMTVAGMRTVYDAPLFTRDYYNRIFQHAWHFPVDVAGKTIRKVSGEKPKDAFRQIQEAFLADWREGFEERGPFMPSDTLTSRPRRYESLSGTTVVGDAVYAVLTGIDTAPEMVRIDTAGKMERIRPFSSNAGDLAWSERLGRIFWSETLTDKRWSLKQTSEIRYLEPGSSKARSLTSGGRYYNPAPEPSGTRLAVTEYPLEATSAIVILSGRTGEELARYPAPDTLQVVESAWTRSGVLVSAISETGFGIYKAGEAYEEIISPEPYTIRQLRTSPEGDLLFACDRTGVSELYLAEHDGTTRQLTNTRYGASAYAFSKDGKTLYYSALAPEARYLCSTPASALPANPADMTELHSYAIADRLSAQEDSLARLSPSADTISIGSPEIRAYHKGAHLLHFHSWAPAYIDYDEVSSISWETISSAATLGASAMFQSLIGDAYGTVGYSLGRADSGSGLSSSMHATFNYNGWYPKIEAKLNFNDGKADQYHIYLLRYANGTAAYARGIQQTSVPAISGTVSVRVPLNFSSGGWQRGVIPQVQYVFSNSMFASSTRGLRYLNGLGNEPVTTVFGGFLPGKNVPLHRAALSLRGYCILPTSTAGVYPRWGIGAETGGSMRINLESVFSPSVYAYLYGYVPGIIPQHGLRLSALVQRQFGGEDCVFGENTSNTYPRGMSGTAAYIAAAYPTQSKATADYKMTVLPVDWTFLGRLAYIRNFELTLHTDVGLFAGSRYRSLTGKGTLCSAGLDFSAVLGNLLWIPYDTRIGFTCTINGGSLYDGMKQVGASVGRTYFGTVFTVDL